MGISSRKAVATVKPASPASSGADKAWLSNACGTYTQSRHIAATAHPSAITASATAATNSNATFDMVSVAA